MEFWSTLGDIISALWWGFVIFWVSRSALKIVLNAFPSEKSKKIAHLEAALASERETLARLRVAINDWNKTVNTNQKDRFKAKVDAYRPPIAQYWQLLGIDPTHDTTAIQKAFRAKVKAAHPDRGGSKQAFQAVYAARDAAMAFAGHPLQGSTP